MSLNAFDFSVFDHLAVPRARFESGEKIFLEDDEGDAMFVVLSGRVNLVTFGTVLENVVKYGCFGEMSLIDDAPRSAAALAMEATEVAVINRALFLVLVRDEPAFSLYVMQKLASRIRRMNKSL